MFKITGKTHWSDHSLLSVPVLSNVRPGEDDASGSVRQLQRPRGERVRVWPGRPSCHGAGLRYVPVPAPLLRAPSFPVLTQHQHQEQPSSQWIPPVANWTLGRGEASHTILQPLKLLVIVHESCNFTILLEDPGSGSWTSSVKHGCVLKEQMYKVLVFGAQVKRASTSLLTMTGY